MGPAGGEPLGDRFAALAGLRAEGLIRHLGVSHVDATQLAEARTISPVTLAIPGVSTLAHLTENIAAADLRLTPGDLAELAAMGPPGYS